MEQNQAVSSEVSTATEYQSASNAYPIAAAGDPAEGVAYAAVDGSDPSAGHVYGTYPTTVAADAAPATADPEAAGYAVPNSVGYDTANGGTAAMVAYHSTGVVENGNVSGETAAEAADQQFEEVYSPEEERLWSMLRANSLDFNSWTALIEETERVAENNILKIRKVYDAFLAEFPLCFGYWKKYADHEARLDGIEKVVEVYERAVLAVTYSVDIWLHYCVFAISTYDDPEIIRRLFERGLAYVGTDYLSYPLWDEYIRYEESQQAWSHLAMIYTRILENPIHNLERYYHCFKELSANRPLSEIRTAEEAALMASTLETTSQGVEGEVPPDCEQSSKIVSGGLTEAEELEKYVAIREELYKKAKEFDAKIVGFETAIRRPYFHVRPLDDPELENWHHYLDFIERGDDFNKVVKLYERCLIACANYPEFWIRYVLCMEATGSMELANNALARATQVFVKKQPEIHLFAARFKEMNEDIDGARAEYDLLHSDIFPCFLEAIVKHANMEYRLGNKEAAFSVYEKFVAAEQAKEQSPFLPMLLVQYARFLYLVVGNAEKAREILNGALEHMKLSRPLLEAIIHLESIQPLSKRVDYLDSLVEKFISPDFDNAATAADREEISSIFLEFLDLFGDKASIKKAENRHALLFLRQKSVLVSKKRQAEDFLTSDKSKVAKTYTAEPSPDQYNAQNPAGYGQKNPAWTQTSQAQGQQWNPGYTQQAGYTAYGGYAGYGQQQPPSTPQTATYGAYPPTYPAQAYPQPQQGYAQPAAAYPQPAPVTQTYYSSY